MKRLQPFWLAMALLTVVPVGRFIRMPVTPEEQGRSVACYPLVGLLVGALLALLAGLIANVPASLGAVLLLSFWVAITGAMHLDGLADCSDAAAAGHADPARMLDVMKDPACGPVAVSVLVLVLLIKLAALISVGTVSTGLLLAACVLARSAAAVLMLTTDYRRSDGIAAAHSTNLRVAVVVGIIAALVMAGLFVLPFCLWALLVLASGLCVLGWRHFWKRRIGGYTGDIAGGLIELVEVVVLVVGALAA